MINPSPEINPSLEINRLSDSLVYIDNFLAESVVAGIAADVAYLERNAHDLDRSTWSLRFHDDRRDYVITGDKYEKYKGLRETVFKLYQRDPESVASLYYWYKCLFFPPVEGGEVQHSQSQGPVWIDHFNTFRKEIDNIYAVFEYIHSEAFLNFLGGTLGFDFPFQMLRSQFALTRYDRGSFISPHTDVSSEDEYQLTLLYYLNPEWQEDQGGVLHYVLEDKSVIALPPVRNRLVLFQPSFGSEHFVSPVSMETDNGRYCISGWYM